MASAGARRHRENREHRSWSALKGRESISPVASSLSKPCAPPGRVILLHHHPVAALRLPPATISRPSGALPIVRRLRLLTSSSDSARHVLIGSYENRTSGEGPSLRLSKAKDPLQTCDRRLTHGGVPRFAKRRIPWDVR